MASSREEKINELLESIRMCRDCKEAVDFTYNTTPVVYGTKDARILLVSENPPKKAWYNNLGKTRRTTINIAKTKRTSSNITDYFSSEDNIFTIEEAERLLFWIQRANCHVKRKSKDVYSHCSRKYIQWAISVVKPRMIVALGKDAGNWFFPRRSMPELVGNDKYTRYRDLNNKEHDIFVLFHPSNVAAYWRKEYKNEHERSLEWVRDIVADLKRE